MWKVTGQTIHLWHSRGPVRVHHLVASRYTPQCLMELLPKPVRSTADKVEKPSLLLLCRCFNVKISKSDQNGGIQANFLSSSCCLQLVVASSSLVFQSSLKTSPITLYFRLLIREGSRLVMKCTEILKPL